MPDQLCGFLCTKRVHGLSRIWPPNMADPHTNDSRAPNTRDLPRKVAHGTSSGVFRPLQPVFAKKKNPVFKGSLEKWRGPLKNWREGTESRREGYKKGRGQKGGDEPYKKKQGSECIHTKDARFRVHPYKRYKVQSVSIVYLKKGKGTKGGR